MRNTQDTSSKAINYKRQVASKYIAIDVDYIDSKLKAFDTFIVSLKYDGHYYAISYENEEAILANRNGKILDRLPIHETIEQQLKSKKVKRAFIAGELYFSANNKRTRHFDTTKAKAKGGEGLKFAAFDMTCLDDQDLSDNSYFEKIQQLGKLLEKEADFHLIKHLETDSIQDVKDYFKEQVEENGQEGIVIKTDGVVTFKVKPKYTFDAVIVGFAQGDGERSNLLRDFLLAFRKEDGSYQTFAHLSHGFSDEQREQLLKEYQKKVVKSDYTEVARNKLGFQMITPDTVVEFSCIDVINQDSKGNINKMNLHYDEENGYSANYQQNTVSVTIPVFLRFREDKQATIEETSFEQMMEVTSFDDAKVENEKREASEIIKRQVYRKESRGSIMVKKFVLIETKKEDFDYPAYVLHVTDFSTGRKDPLKKDVLVSNCKKQIYELYDEAHNKGIKAGWEEVIA